MADVVAKLDSQSVLAHLFGIAVGIQLIQFSSDPQFLFKTFAVLFPFQVLCSYFSLKAVKLAILNQGRALDIAQEYLHNDGKLKTLKQYQDEEKLFGEWILPHNSNIPHVTFGDDFSLAFNSAAVATSVLEILKDENYLLGYNHQSRSFNVVLNGQANNLDVLKAILHISYFRKDLSSTQVNADDEHSAITDILLIEILTKSLIHTNAHFESFREAVRQSGFRYDNESFSWIDNGSRIEWQRKAV